MGVPEGFYLPEAISCPICGAALERDGGSLACRGERRHTYDIAKEGYVNLLPPGRAKNAKTGDSAQMIRAREDFLSGGGYDRYSAEAAAFAVGFMGEVSGEPLLLDSGCGEGRHTVNMARVIADATDRRVIAAGFDASKFGAMAAAKRYVRGEAPRGVLPFFAAGNIFSLPVSDSSVDVFTSLFAPLPDGEARRTVKEGGLLVICAAGGGHLSQLREILYENPIPSGGGAAVPEGFRTVGEKVIEYPLILSAAGEIEALFTMTPFYHNATLAGRARLLEKDSLTVTVQVRCTVAVRESRI